MTLITQKITQAVFSGATADQENQLLSITGSLSNYNFVSTISPTEQKLRIIDKNHEVMAVDLRAIELLQTQAEGEDITTVFDDINPNSETYINNLNQGSGHSYICVTEKNIFIAFRTTTGYRVVALRDCQILFYEDGSNQKQQRFFFSGVDIINDLGENLSQAGNTSAPTFDIDHLGMVADDEFVYVFTPADEGVDVFKITIDNPLQVVTAKLPTANDNKIAVSPIVIGDYVYFMSGSNSNQGSALQRINRNTLHIERLATGLQPNNQAIYNTPKIAYQNGLIYAAAVVGISSQNLSVKAFSLSGTLVLDGVVTMPEKDKGDDTSGVPSQYVKTFCCYGNKMFVPTLWVSNTNKPNELDLFRINLDDLSIEEHVEITDHIYDCYVDKAGKLISVSVDSDFTSYNLGDSNAKVLVFDPYNLSTGAVLSESLEKVEISGIARLNDFSTLGITVNKSAKTEQDLVVGETTIPSGTPITEALRLLSESIPIIEGSTGKKVEIVSGVMRNTNGIWSLIDDAGHTNSGIESITQGQALVEINFKKSFGKISCFLCGSDETYTANGISAGHSVTTEKATVTLAQNTSIHDYVYYDGSEWKTLYGTFDVNYNNGVIELNHSTKSMSGLNINTSFRDSAGTNYANMRVVTSGGYTDTGKFSLRIQKPNGTLFTGSAKSDMQFIASRTSSGIVINSESDIPGSNVWFFGLMELK